VAAYSEEAIGLQHIAARSSGCSLDTRSSARLPVYRLAPVGMLLT